jgi:phosphoribosylformylglycinamidine synthase
LYDVDPYLMAVAAVDEALRNVVCVGGDPQRTAILDNFCWPKADTEESLGGLVRACKGAADAAVAYGLPFISGKDSLNNEYTMSEQEAARVGLPSRLAIPGTLLISALAIVEDVNRCVSMDLKQPGDVLALASAPADRAGLAKAVQMHARVAELIRAGRVRAAHDVSDGGLAVAVAEMCIASELGATVAIQEDDFADSLFAPLLTSYVLEMTEEAARVADLPIIGRVTEEPWLKIAGPGQVSIELTVPKLASAWKRSLLARGGGG